MDRDMFSNIPHFLAVASHGSFAAAAAALEISPTAMSKAIRSLERKHGAMLFQRTTRRVHLTEAGTALFNRLDRATHEIRDALEDFGASHSTPTGTLRLTVPHSTMSFLVQPILVRFATLYPGIKVELSVNDSFVDLVAEGFDAGIRLGRSIDRDMIAVRLTTRTRWTIVASPDYLAMAGRPTTLEELMQHQAIMFRLPGSKSLHRWKVERNGHTHRLEMPHRIIVDNHHTTIALAKAGLGFALAMEHEVADDLKRGELEHFFIDDTVRDDGIFLYFSGMMQSQPKLRAFIDVAKSIAREKYLEV